MFRLMIVEDEKITRDGLCRHIDWNTLNVEVVLSVSNGLEAVMAADTASPDILLSDIKMPHMTGIELAQIIRKRFPKCKIIFLSGYADKEYLMSAIQLKAVSYIEKPVNLEEIKEAVKTAVEQLACEQKEAMIHNSFQQTKPLVNYEIVSALLNPDTDWQKFDADYVPLYFNWSRIGSYFAACIQISTQHIPQEQTKLPATDAIEFICRHIHDSASDCYINHISPDRIAMVARNITPGSVMSILQKLQQHLNDSCGIDSAIAISPTCMALTDISSRYKDLCMAMDYEIFYGPKNCFLVNALAPVSNPAPSGIFAINELNMASIEELFSMLKKETYTDIAFIRSALFKLYMVAAEKNWNSNIISWKEFEQLTLKEYEELIYYELNILRLLGDGTYDIKIKKAIYYILAHYSIPELSVKMIADHIGLSQNYLSTLFKNQTGSTINDFIISIRLEEACTLLTKTDLKLYEIAERIGLQDPNYLSSLFKKQFSVTPSQYKKGGCSHGTSGKISQENITY